MPYFDTAATTKIHPKALQALHDTMRDVYGNPSSLHHVGIEARKLMNQTKAQIAALLGCDKRQLIMTGSGTEANNLAIQGVYQKHPEKRLITSRVEHHASLNTMRYLQSKGADVVILPADEKGRIDIAALSEALTVDTSLVSIIYGNNEVGTLQDLEAIINTVKNSAALIHLDMVQVPLHQAIDFNQLKVDFISLSAHKFHGPRGVGILIANDLASFDRLIHGGKQEYEKRSGTENLAGLVATKVALEEAYKNHTDNVNHSQSLSEYFIQKLNDSGIEYSLNGPQLNDPRLPNILNIGFKDLDAQWLSFELNQHGIYVSLGSACDSSNIEPSHVLKAIHVPEAYIHGSLRFSFGAENTKEDIDMTIDALKTIIEDA